MASLPFRIAARKAIETTPSRAIPDSSPTSPENGAKAGYGTAKGINLFIEGRNILDENYASSTGVIADAQGKDSNSFLPGDGRAVYAGIEYRW